jgi:hypothetical protein
VEVQQSVKDGWEVVSDSFVDVEARTIQQLQAMREGKSTNRTMQLANRSSFGGARASGGVYDNNMQVLLPPPLPPLAVGFLFLPPLLPFALLILFSFFRTRL